MKEQQFSVTRMKHGGQSVKLDGGCGAAIFGAVSVTMVVVRAGMKVLPIKFVCCSVRVYTCGDWSSFEWSIFILRSRLRGFDAK